jgi:hypothetical protein
MGFVCITLVQGVSGSAVVIPSKDKLQTQLLCFTAMCSVCCT